MLGSSVQQRYSLGAYVSLESRVTTDTAFTWAANPDTTIGAAVCDVCPALHNCLSEIFVVGVIFALIECFSL